MAAVVLSGAADADMAGVIEDLHRLGGQRTAPKYRKRFGDVYGRLGAHPESGALRIILGPDVRIVIVQPYILIYRYVASAKTVLILRIVHGRRKVTGQMLA